MFNLRNPRLIAALQDAYRAGVVVQVMMPESKLDLNKSPWQADTVNGLTSVGIPLFMDRKRWPAESRHSSALVGAWLPGFGSFHAKIRLFRWRDSNGDVQEEAWTGSINPNDESVANDEALCQVRDNGLRDQYVSFYEALRDQREVGFPNTWTPGAPLNALLDPGNGHDLADHLLDWIDAEKELIFMSIFSVFNFDSPLRPGYTVFHALEKAHERGCWIVFICDIHMCEGEPLIEKLKLTGWDNLHIYQLYNPVGQWNAIHFKEVVLVGSQRLVTDSTNWSMQAMGSAYNIKNKPPYAIFARPKFAAARSVETMLFIDGSVSNDARLPMRSLKRHFVTLDKYWWQANSNTTYSGLPPRELLKKLAGRFGARLPFTRTTVYVQKPTKPGQFVGLRGGICDDAGVCAGQPLMEYASYWNGDTLDLKVSLRHLSWESSSALDWTCNKAAYDTRSDRATYLRDGYGYDSELDALVGASPAGENFWKFDAYVDGQPGQWMAFKLVMTDGPGGPVIDWETDVRYVMCFVAHAMCFVAHAFHASLTSNSNTNVAEIPAALASSRNHLVQLGSVYVFRFGKGSVVAASRADVTATRSTTPNNAMLPVYIAVGVVGGLVFVVGGFVVAVVVARRRRNAAPSPVEAPLL